MTPELALAKRIRETQESVRAGRIDLRDAAQILFGIFDQDDMAATLEAAATFLETKS